MVSPDLLHGFCPSYLHDLKTRLEVLGIKFSLGMLDKGCCPCLPPFPFMHLSVIHVDVDQLYNDSWRACICVDQGN